MNGKEKTLVDYILSRIHWCPFEDGSGVDFNKCAGFGKDGCGDCIYRNADKLIPPNEKDKETPRL